jgi:hypothetical protein
MKEGGLPKTPNTTLAREVIAAAEPGKLKTASELRISCQWPLFFVPQRISTSV